MPDDGDHWVTHEVLAERIDGIRTLLNRALYVGSALMMAMFIQGLLMYRDVSLNSAYVAEAKQNRLPESLAEIRGNRFTNADGAALSATVNLKLDNLSAKITELQVSIAKMPERQAR